MKSLRVDVRSRLRLPHPYRGEQFLAALVVVLAAIMLAGCGKKGGGNAVEGQIVWNGQPLAGAQVALYPEGPSDTKATPPRGQTDSEGRFHLSTPGTADGVPEGKYAVTVVYYPMRPQEGGAGPNALPKKYASPKTTDLRVEVTGGKNTLPALVLQYPDGKAGVSRPVSYR